MNKEEKKQFIKDLTSSITEEILQKIENDNIPENWDGIELRWYLRDRYEWNASYQRKTKREKDYKNEIIVRDL